MATTTTRIKDIPTTATTAAPDDYFVIDGATNGTRKYAHNASASAYGLTIFPPLRGELLAPVSTTYTKHLATTTFTTPTAFTWSQILALGRLGGATDLVQYKPGWTNCKAVGQSTFATIYPQSWEISFMFLGQSLEVSLVETVADCVALVDGQVAAVFTPYGSGTINFHKLDFGAFGLREITLCFHGSQFNGVTIDANSYIYPARAQFSRKAVFIGDSITYGYYIANKEVYGWVPRLRRKLGWNCFDSGISGETTAQAAARVAADVIAVAPDLVVWNFGRNDPDTDQLRIDTLANLSAVKAALPSCTQIVMSPIGWATARDARLKAAAEAVGAAYIQAPASVPFYDAIHPSAAATPYIADFVAEKLWALGFGADAKVLTV